MIPKINSFMPAAIMAVAVVLMAMAPAAIAWTSSTGIQMSSGLTGWGGFPLGGSGEGGGAAFDPVAAAKAMLTGAWTDKDFQNALISYAMATSQNKFSSTTPTFMEFLEQAYTSSGGTGSVQFQAVQQLAEEGKPLVPAMLKSKPFSIIFYRTRTLRLTAGRRHRAAAKQLCKNGANRFMGGQRMFTIKSLAFGTMPARGISNIWAATVSR